MIGKMKDRITAKTIKRNPNGRGGWTLQEVDIGTFWGEILQMSERNIIQYRQADLNTNVKIRMRANVLITKETSLYARGNKYAIDEVLEKDGFYIIMAVGEKINE